MLGFCIQKQWKREFELRFIIRASKDLMALIVTPRLPLEEGSHQVWKSNPALWWRHCHRQLLCQSESLVSKLTVQYLNVNSSLHSH